MTKPKREIELVDAVEEMVDGDVITFLHGESRTVICCDCGLPHKITVKLDGDVVVTEWTQLPRKKKRKK